eukprot:CAMPEP_0181127454 /NCGR_PEP_ID=MMETSP1071-20121207/28207_1 /TAXON_ID=35127 /ORGANISM="Thalassiosira sp., Strain NH16" /LENGTH=51 /DNA_ID=CAMNT_0023213195 /DNA_START=43 /DNA_END=194 /DNA_ORIENTATION=+
MMGEAGNGDDDGDDGGIEYELAEFMQLDDDDDDNVKRIPSLEVVHVASSSS